MIICRRISAREKLFWFRKTLLIKFFIFQLTLKFVIDDFNFSLLHFRQVLKAQAQPPPLVCVYSLMKKLHFCSCLFYATMRNFMAQKKKIIGTSEAFAWQLWTRAASWRANRRGRRQCCIKRKLQNKLTRLQQHLEAISLVCQRLHKYL